MSEIHELPSGEPHFLVTGRRGWHPYSGPRIRCRDVPLKELRAYPFYFQFTLTPYGKDVEPGVPSKNDVILPSFQELSRRIGPERVIWRYDPILFTDRYTMDYHITFFSQLARRLEGYTRKCIISFVDLYRNTQTT